MATKAELSRRGFLKAGGATVLALLLLRFPDPEEGYAAIEPVYKNNEGDYLIQTGIKELDVSGNKIQIEADPERFKEVILMEAGKRYGKDFVTRANDWLKHNQVEFEVYELLSRPTEIPFAGYFTPPEFNSGRAKISVPDTKVRQLYENPISDEDFSPLTILPHEIYHLVEYIKSPLSIWGRVALITAEVAVSAYLALAEKEEKSVRFGKSLKFIRNQLLFQLLNLVTGLDSHSHIPGEEEIKQQMFDDTAYGKAVRGMVKFKPTDEL